MRRVYFHQATLGKSNQKIGKTSILVCEKVTQLVAKALVVARRKKKLVKVKPQY